MYSRYRDISAYVNRMDFQLLKTVQTKRDELCSPRMAAGDIPLHWPTDNTMKEGAMYNLCKTYYHLLNMVDDTANVHVNLNVRVI